MFSGPVPQDAASPSIWNALPGFDTVEEDDELGNVGCRSTDLPQSTRMGTLPEVAWFFPAQSVSEHLPARDRGPDLGDAADQHDHERSGLDEHVDLPYLGRLGRLLDHVKPPVVDGGDTASACPGWSSARRPGRATSTTSRLRRLYQVHRERLPGRTAARPGYLRTARFAADRRDNAKILGNLARDLDFTQ